MRSPIVLMLTLALFSTATPSRAEFGGHGIGPTGGYATAIGASKWEPNMWFLGTTSGGVFRLVSGSAEWEHVGWVLPDNGVVVDFASTLAAPGVVFAITYANSTGRHYVFRSVNSGVVWQIRGLGLPLDVYDIDCDPLDSLRAYAGTGLGVYRTTDAGYSWHRWKLQNEMVQAIAVDPGDPDRIWAAAYGTGVFRSDDHGETWQVHTTGMGGTFYFYSLVPGGSGGRIYSLGYTDYRSTDNGDTWAQLVPCEPPSIGTLALRAGDPDDILAATNSCGLLRSRDGGTTWVEVLPPRPNINPWYPIVGRDPVDPDRAIVSRLDGAILLSSDDASSWAEHDDGISDGTAWTIDISGSRILAGTGNGVFVSEDAGRHWMRSDLDFVRAGANCLAFAPGDGQTAFCAAAGYASGAEGEVLRTADGGHTWISVLQLDTAARAVAVDPTDPRRVYAGTAQDVGGGRGEIYRSTDGGEHWLQVHAGYAPAYCILVDPANPAIVLAGTGYVYGSGGGGVLRSTNHGDTWSDRGPQYVTITDISPDAIDPQRFYASSVDGAWTSADAGFTWSPLGSGLPSDVYSIEGRDATVGVLVGTSTTIWRYSGGEWLALPPEDQPTAVGIPSLCAMGDGRFFAGTKGAGVWEYLSNPAGAPDAIPVSSWLRIGGSPSNGPFVIRPARHGSGTTRVEIIDIAGRIVRAYESDRNDFWSWDSRDDRGMNVPAGMYIVRARMGGRTETGKICVIR